MQLRDALDDFKRYGGHETLFPGERRSTRGLFSGSTVDRAANGDARLVHVSPDGAPRDFGEPLTGETGLVRSRIGVRREHDDVLWFDEWETVSQRYRDGTTLIVTEYDVAGDRLTQYDLTVGDAHLTHFEADLTAEIVAFLGFAPDGRDARIGQLHHENAVEVFHAAEHDYVASANGFSSVDGRIPATFAELLDDVPVPHPRDRDAGRYEDNSLSGNLVCSLPMTDGGATLVTLLTDRTETTREHALGRLDELTTAYSDPSAFERAADARAVSLPDGTPHADAAVADLRVLGFLSASTGLRIAGPDFDPYYVNSGGYGYTWFRDDAEISHFLLESDRRFGLGLDAWHERSVRSFCEAQRPDGTWPHRVWPRDGALAPGWANGRLEAGDDVDYQADQTASVVTFLASVLDDFDGIDDAVAADLSTRIAATLVDALDGLDDTLADDRRPIACQNAWEDATGRFVHTAATFLEAYATLATTDLDVADHAAEQAHRVYDALDDLWVPERGIFALREVTETEYVAVEDDEGAVESIEHSRTVAFEAGELDDRCDSASLALASAHLAYAEVGTVDGDRLDRLVSHVGTVIDELWHESDDVRGLVRYEGDEWRRAGQAREKIWTVSTAWGASAAANLGSLLAATDDPRAATFDDHARTLLGLVLPDGPLCLSTTYLPEQLFDDGTPDSATPLGWPHAIRLATVAQLDERDALSTRRAVADD